MQHKAKKTLGQNFLKSELALRKIIEVGEIKPDDIILEIGPGKGALTKKILEKAGTVIAVEKDRELIEFLKTKFAKEITTKKIILVEDDILKFNLEQDILERTLGRSDGDGQRKFSAENFRGESENILLPISYKIIANIPYNITGAILKRFLTEKNQPERMVLMVQNEVAKRIVASDKKESVLSISVKAYGEPKMVMKVPARYFSPEPKVDSAIIIIKNISRRLFEKNNTSPQPSPCQGEGGNGTVQNKILDSQAFEEKFWEIVKTGFAHKRKKLSGNLKSLKNYEVLTKNDFMQTLGNKRAEDLTLEDWISLTK